MAGAEPSDETLLAATQHDPEAFGVFYRRHAPAVLAFLAYRTGDAERALDLTSDVFAVALDSSDRYQEEQGPARGWLFGIARHLLIDHRRRRAAADRARRRLGLERLTFEDAELARVEELVDLARRERPLYELVGDLSAEQREAVLARIVDERSYGEIAADQGVSEQTVRQRVSRGLARLADWTRGDQHA